MSIATQTFPSIADNALYIGITTRQLLCKLEDDGDTTPAQVKIFYQAVRGFYSTAAEYALKNLPLKDAALQNARFLGFETREAAVFSQVEFFVNRYIHAILFSL